MITKWFILNFLLCFCLDGIGFSLIFMVVLIPVFCGLVFFVDLALLPIICFLFNLVVTEQRKVRFKDAVDYFPGNFVLSHLAFFVALILFGSLFHGGLGESVLNILYVVANVTPTALSVYVVARNNACQI